MEPVSSNDIATVLLKDDRSFDKGTSEKPEYPVQTKDSFASMNASNRKQKHDTIGAVLSPSCEVAPILFSTDSKLREQALQRQQTNTLLHTSFAASKAPTPPKPLSELLNMASQRQQMNTLLQSSTETSRAPAPPKPLNFDPPTFKFGSTSSNINTKEDSKSTASSEDLDLLRDLFGDSNSEYITTPSHRPGNKWLKRDIDLLVECSKRWIRNDKRRKVSQDSTQS